MATLNKLTALDLRKNTPRRYNDGGGLYLQVTNWL
jgi:hypothetical protein